MKSGVATALVLGGLGLLYFVISEMKKREKKKQEASSKLSKDIKFCSSQDSSLISNQLSETDKLNDKTSCNVVISSIKDVELHQQLDVETVQVVSVSDSIISSLESTEKIAKTDTCDDNNSVILQDLSVCKPETQLISHTEQISEIMASVSISKETSEVVENSNQVNSVQCDELPMQTPILTNEQTVTESVAVVEHETIALTDAKASDEEEIETVQQEDSLKMQELKETSSNNTIVDRNINSNEPKHAEKSRNQKRREKRKNKKILESKTPPEASPASEMSNESKCEVSDCAAIQDEFGPPKNYSSPDLASTSDWEREASPEQENMISDSQSLISQASVDSGQGSIEVEPDTIFSSLAFPSSGTSDQYIFYQFDIPQDLVGRLIGRKGTFVNKIKASTNATVVVLEHQNEKLKLCSVEGYRSPVSDAIKMIRKQFPLSNFPELSLDQVNTPAPSPVHEPQIDREVLQVKLTPGVVNETQASYVSSGGEVWLQQPLHPSFSSLQRLHQCINLNYGDGSSTPALPSPLTPTTVCVCQIESQWLRCQISESDDEFALVTLLDVGGTMQVPLAFLRQIRVDYMHLPFQASQCFLYGLQPADGELWTSETQKKLEQLVQKTILFVTIAAYSEEGIPFVNLYKREFNEYVYINKKLVELGCAKWLNPDLEQTPT